MPTYDYVCRACGHEFELFQQMTAKVKRKCPECGLPKLERLIGIGAGVLFKGGGFYETDYRSDSYKKGAEAEKKAADGKSTTDGKDRSESKPETKPDSKSGSKTEKSAGKDAGSGKKSAPPKKAE